MFGREFQSEYRLNLSPIFGYENRRHELAGILTRQDQEKFTTRMSKLINKDNRRNKRRAKKDKMR
jgi:hypothetical protein